MTPTEDEIGTVARAMAVAITGRPLRRTDRHLYGEARRFAEDLAADDLLPGPAEAHRRVAALKERFPSLMRFDTVALHWDTALDAPAAHGQESALDQVSRVMAIGKTDQREIG